MNFGNTGNVEILQIADSVARERGISKEIVIEAMEQAIQVASRKKYGQESNIVAHIDRKTGEIRLYRNLEIVEKPEDHSTQISLEDALLKDENAHLGGSLHELLPPIDLGRVTAQAAKQVIVQKVRDAERDRQYEEFKDRVGEIIHGVVKRVDYGNVVVDLLNRAEGFLAKEELIRNELYRQNDRIKAYIMDVRREPKGPQIFLSRTNNMFLAKLFVQEVPEIYDGIIEIKGVVRDAGSKAKIAVYSKDPSIDAVGSCVGIRGARVQAVINELQGEKIDIIQWSSDPATYVINALTPATVSKVIIDEEARNIEVIVGNDQLSLAIGRRGQNVRLASQLTGWKIEISSEEESAKRKLEEFNILSYIFMHNLDIDEVLAQLLVAEGFTSIEELALVDISELLSIEGIEEELAAALQERARSYLHEYRKFADSLIAKGVDKKLLHLRSMNREIAEKLQEEGITNLLELMKQEPERMKEILGDVPEVIIKDLVSSRRFK